MKKSFVQKLAVAVRAEEGLVWNLCRSSVYPGSPCVGMNFMIRVFVCHFLSEVEGIPRAGVNCGWSMAD